MEGPPRSSRGFEGNLVDISEVAWAQRHAEGCATKGGISKCEQTQADADFVQSNVEKRKQTQMCKCEQLYADTPPY